MTDHQRLYARLLRLYPAEFRDHYGAEMRRLFAEQLWDARKARGRTAIAALWARTILDVAVTAPREHVAPPSRVRQPVGGPPETIAVPRRTRPWWRTLMGLTPLVAFAFIVSRWGWPRFDKPPEMLGLPLGVVVLGVALAIMLAGVLALRRTSSSLAAVLIILLFTFPATILVVIGPAIIFILQNLKA